MRADAALTRPMTSEADWVTGSVGTFCTVGSAKETACAPGTYNPLEGKEDCVRCAAGTYQDLEGNITCKACTPGYYCATGSAAPLPCPGGTRKDPTLTRPMTSEADCVTCDVGTFCPVGSAHETACAPGTYNPLARQANCVRCAAGSYPALDATRNGQAFTPAAYYTTGYDAAGR